MGTNTASRTNTMPVVIEQRSSRQKCERLPYLREYADQRKPGNIERSSGAAVLEGDLRSFGGRPNSWVIIACFFHDFVQARVIVIGVVVEQH